ncbi:MAG TPA: hypothetical protein VL463_27515 [Kofleriaceae bacterium]|nr:hypothetical protein [Kofleriaceae bacterium]
MTKRGWIVALVVVSSFFAWRQLRGSDRDRDRVGVADRIWIDHIPSSDRDAVNAFIVLTEEPVGIFQQSSVWRGAFEIFRWEGRGDQLRVVYPQTGEKETIRARATRCDERGMDYCLEVSGASHGVAKYYSRKGWEIDGDDLAGATRALASLVRQ